jgi:hypothetical protein
LSALYETRFLAVEGQTPSFERERPLVIPAIFKPESSSFDPALLIPMCKKNWIPAQEHRRNDAGEGMSLT